MVKYNGNRQHPQRGIYRFGSALPLQTGISKQQRRNEEKMESNKEQRIMVTAGKDFQVQLQSMLGSTCYGWCLRGLADDVYLMAIENIPLRPGQIGPVNQCFYFGVAPGHAAKDITLIFDLVCLNDLSDIRETAEIHVSISNAGTCPASSSFVQYSENFASYQPASASYDATSQGKHPWQAMSPFQYGYAYQNPDCK